MQKASWSMCRSDVHGYFNVERGRVTLQRQWIPTALHYWLWLFVNFTWTCCVAKHFLNKVSLAALRCVEKQVQIRIWANTQCSALCTRSSNIHSAWVGLYSHSFPWTMFTPGCTDPKVCLHWAKPNNIFLIHHRAYYFIVTAALSCRVF